MTKSKEEFSEENIPESNWFSFEEIGDAIRGTLIKKPYLKASGNEDMPDQIVYELTKVDIDHKDGAEDTDPEAIYNVGLSIKKEFVHSRLRLAKVGQRIGFKFIKEIPASKKGFAPAKSINPYMWDMDEDYLKSQESMEETEGVDVSDVIK